jgi:hypothetical protein
MAGILVPAAQAGSLTSLASGSLSGSSLTISSINGTYKSLQLRIVNLYSPNAVVPIMRLNSDSTAGNYNYVSMRSAGTTLSGSSSAAQFPISGAGEANANRTQFIINIDAYTVNAYKNIRWNTNTPDNAYLGLALWKSTSAVTAITILFDGTDTFSAGGTYELFGVK